MPRPSKGGTSFVRQAAILAAASLFVRFIGFAYRIPLTHLIGDEGNALYGAAYNIYGVAVVISSGALPASISRLVSERLAKREFYNAHEMFKTSMIFALVAGAIVGLAMWFGAEFMLSFMHQPEAFYALRALAPTLFFVAMLAVFRGYFQGMKTAIPTALSQVLEQIVNVAFSVLLAFALYRASGLEAAVGGASAGTGIGAIAGLGVVIVIYGIMSRTFKWRAARDNNPRESRYSQFKVLLFTTLPIVFGMVVFQLTNIIDIRMASSRMLAAGYFSESEVRALVGQFTGKFILLITLPAALSFALSSAIIPEITSSKVKMETAAIKHKTDMALRIAMILSIPAAVGLAVLADPIIALLFPGHPGGGWLIRYGSVAIVFMALCNVLTGTLQGLGYVKLPAIAAVFGVATKIPVNYALIGERSINILGAVISTIICYAVAAAINMYFLYKHTRILPSLASAFIKPFVAAVGMGMICYVAYHTMDMLIPTPLATLVALAAGAGAYVMFMCVIKGFRESDLMAAPLPNMIKRWLIRL